MKLKKLVIMLLSMTSALGWAQPMEPSAARPPRYPAPGRPAPPKPNPGAPAPRPPAPAPRPPAPAPRPPAPAPRPPAPRPRPPAPRPRPPAPAPRPPAPRPPAPVYPGPVLENVYISVSRTLYNYDVLRLQDYINLYHYAGYRLQSVEIDAEAWDGTQRLTLMVNQHSEADAYITGRHAFLTMYPISYVSLGNVYDLSLMMRGNGAVHIHHVTLRLVR